MMYLSENRPIETRKVRLLLAEESPTVRQIIREELQKASWVEVVAEANNSHDAVALFFQLKPDVAIISTCLNGHGGFEVLRCIRSVFGNCATILTSRQPDPFVAETGRVLGAAAVCCVAQLPTQLVSILQSATNNGRSTAHEDAIS
jgi:DNA-binding NarL/FixJ family response regulator